MRTINSEPILWDMTCGASHKEALSKEVVFWWARRMALGRRIA